MTIDELVVMIAKSKQHRYLYHFTDTSNFESVKKKGLLSKARMKKERLWPEMAGGDEFSWNLDKRRGIYDDVNLCMTTSHPMEYSVKKRGGFLNQDISKSNQKS